MRGVREATAPEPGAEGTLVVKSQTDRVLDVLRDGEWHTIQEIHAVVGPCRLNSRIADLRAKGHDIICDRQRVTPRFGFGRPETVYRYRLVRDSERGPGATGNGGDSGLEAAADRGANGASTRADTGDGPSVSSRSEPTLDEYGVDRAVAEANAEHPGLLVDAVLSRDENQRRLADLQQAIFGRAA